MSDEELVTYIDYTLLKADATKEAIQSICAEAKRFSVASVCVNSSRIALIAEELKGTSVKACSVVGFPLGAMRTEAKVAEAAGAIRAGAQEIDMVMNIGAAKDGDWDAVQNDIAAVVAVSRGMALVKVIIETYLLTNAEKVEACLAAKAAGADFVKTSTGFSTGGANVEDIALMRETVGPGMGVKASGGIHSREMAEAMIAAGATRIGASSMKAILMGFKS